MIDACTRAWCAGFFDGEGSVQIARKAYPYGPREFFYELVVSVANTDVAALFPFLDWGGKIYHQNRMQDSTKHRQVHVWKVDKSKRVGRFLVDLRPYLTIKRDRADLALQFAAQQRGRGNRITDTEYAYRGFLWQRMRDLNKRGPR